jgi:hypothetical protein
MNVFILIETGPKGVENCEVFASAFGAIEALQKLEARFGKGSLDDVVREIEEGLSLGGGLRKTSKDGKYRIEVLLSKVEGAMS